VLEAVGIKNILSKSMGSSNHLAVVTATIQGLQQLRTAEVISAIRGEEVKGMSMVSSTVLSSPSDPVDNSSDSTETSPSDIKK
jgi:hypothetical protein